MVANGIIEEIKKLADKGEYFTAWRFIKSLPDSMQVSIIDDVLTEMQSVEYDYKPRKGAVK